MRVYTLFIRLGAAIIKRAIRDRDISLRSANTPRVKVFTALTFLATLARIQHYLYNCVVTRYDSRDGSILFACNTRCSV